MTKMTSLEIKDRWPTLAQMPAPAKALATGMLIVLAIGMFGALGQVIVHDIIPTFFNSSAASHHGSIPESAKNRDGDNLHREDLFSDLPQTDASQRNLPVYKTEQFVWLLKWTHIHLFGMSMIFILLGGITIFLDLGSTVKSWLVLLPFAGVLMDIAAMWLKTYVADVFFWLHVPGGGLFAVIFAVVAISALKEMWGAPTET